MRSLYLRFLLNLIGSFSLFAVSATFAASPFSVLPEWGMQEIHSSQKNFEGLESSSKKPLPQFELSNLSLIIEADKRSVSIIDFNQSKIIHRFKSPHILQNDPKFSPNRHFVYLTSSDGWISKFDMLSLKVASAVRVGIQTRNLTVSADGRYLVTANEQPKSLVLLNASNLEPIKLIEIPSLNGKSSRIGSIFTAAERQSFIVALKDHDEIWEILYKDNPLPVYNGIMHDYRLGEGLAKHQGSFPIRQIKVNDCRNDCLDTLIFHPPTDSVIIRNGKNLQVLQLDARRKIAEIDLADSPNLDLSIFWNDNKIPVLATANLNKAGIIIIDLKNWKIIKNITTDGTVCMLKAHKNSKYILATTRIDPDKDVLYVINKDRLTIEKSLEATPGNRVMDISFDHEGERIMVLYGNNEVIIYNAKTMSELKRFSTISN